MSEEEEEEEKEEEEQEEEEQEEEEPGKPFKLDEVWEKSFSPAGNRTPVSRVTGEDTHHYTTEDHSKFVFRPQFMPLLLPTTIPR